MFGDPIFSSSMWERNEAAPQKTEIWYMVDPDGGNKYHILGNVLLLLGSQVQRWGNYNSHRRGSAEQLTLTSFKVMDG